MNIAIAILVVVVLAVVVLNTTAVKKDTHKATGGLQKETRKSDHATKAAASAVVTKPVSGRQVEQAVAAERTGGAPSTAVATRDAAPAKARSAAPTGWVPPEPEALGVTRRQFLNRGILGLFGISLGAFGTQCIAFLWPSSSGGFGGKVAIPASLNEVLAYYDTNKTPYYYAPARAYISPYPKDALEKAKAIYKDTPSILEDMNQGIIALYQKCVHLGCRVPWCKTSQWFECPCHGSKYNRVGEKKGGPAPRGLDRFPVAIAGGRLTVDTGLVIQGPPIGVNSTGQEAEGPNCVTVGE